MGDALADAVRCLRRGGLVVYPTDTLLGLGALADRPSAVDRLLRAKDRSPTQPVSICVSSTEEVERYALLSPTSRAFLRRSLPGPFTALLPPSPGARHRLPPSVVGTRTIGIRVPDHPVARELARRVGPITATSANRHGEPAARTLTEARRSLGRSVGVYLPARPSGSGTGSTLVDLTGREPRALARG
jgi:L-threonylcarbamoyladenylate synthase